MGPTKRMVNSGSLVMLTSATAEEKETIIIMFPACFSHISWVAGALATADQQKSKPHAQLTVITTVAFRVL